MGLPPEVEHFEELRLREVAPGLARELARAPRTFGTGYLAALDDPRLGPLAARLDALPPDLRGFAYEGAAMCLAVLDVVAPWRRDRLACFVAGPGAPYAYVVHVGAGVAWAQLPVRFERRRRRLDPLLGWLAYDGYGFHRGFFYPGETLGMQRTPGGLGGTALAAFDEGLGRSLWFVETADPRRIAASIEAFPEARRDDLWSGVGLACCYAAGGDPEAIRAAAGRHRGGLAQGAAFGAKARHRAGFAPEASRRACEVLTGLRLEDAARLTDDCLTDDASDDAWLDDRGPDDTAFERWRRRIRERLAVPVAPAHAASRAAAGGPKRGPEDHNGEWRWLRDTG
jgi:hypothetical protein